MRPPLPSLFFSQELWAQVPSQFLSINRPGTGHICEGFSQSVKSTKVGRHPQPHCEWEQNLPMAFQIRGTLRRKRFCLALRWQLALPCWHLLVSPSFVAGRAASLAFQQGLLTSGSPGMLQASRAQQGFPRLLASRSLLLYFNRCSLSAFSTCFFCMRPFRNWSVSEQCGSCLHRVFSQSEPFQKLTGDDTLC